MANTKTIYTPTILPRDSGPIGQYIERELLAMARFVEDSSAIPIFYEEPNNPVEGQWIIADGTSYDPGEGFGVYVYLDGAWEYVALESDFQGWFDTAVSVAWTDATYQNSWVTHSGTPAFNDAGYRKVGDIVYLRGKISTGTIDTAAFTLPSGYRPVLRHTFGILSNGAMGRVDVYLNGEVRPRSPSNNASVSLDGISFSVS